MRVSCPYPVPAVSEIYSGHRQKKKNGKGVKPHVLGKWVYGARSDDHIWKKY